MTNEIPQQPIDPQVASTGGRILSDIGKGIQGASEQLLKVQKVAETTRAQNEHEKALMTVESDFAKEDISSMTPEQIAAVKSKYSTRIEEARSKSADHISMPRWKNQWNMEQQHNSNVTQANLDSMLLKKYVSNAKAQLDTYEAIHQQNYIKTTNVGELTNEIHQLDTNIDAQVHAGFLTTEEGVKQKVEKKQKWDQAHATHYAITAPDQFLDMVKNGFYEGVNIETLDKATQTANRMIERREKTAKAAEKLGQKKTYESFAMQVHDRTAQLPQIEEAFTSKKITPVQFGKLRDQFGASKLTHKSDRAAYMEILESMADDAQNSQDVHDKILSARSSGKLSVQDAQHLAHLHFLKDEEVGTVADDYSDLDKILSEDGAREKASSEKKGVLRSIMDMVKGNPKGQEIVSSAIQEHAKDPKAKVQDLPAVTKQKLAQDFLTRHPEVKNYPKEGVVKVDRYGNHITFYPDGSYEVKSKGNK